MEGIPTPEGIIKAAKTLDCPFWIKTDKIKNERGQILEFTDHRFLWDIYNDWSATQVVRKSGQIGFTTTQILKSLWAAKNKGYNIIYTLPTFQMVQDIVPSKVNSLITQNPTMGNWVKDKDSVFQKQIGDRFIYYRGTASGKTEQEKMETGVGISLSSDLNIHDECDRSDQTVMEQYESRLSASKFGGRWYFSNPTHPMTLSQKIWEESDQKHWFVKCEHCHHLQYLDYWKNISQGKFICDKCAKEISDETRKNGQWVKKYLHRDISGYWIPHLICPWISAEKIQNEYETKSRQYFYNFVLGLPYIGSEMTVNKTVILKNIDQTEPNFQQNNVLGVDVGQPNHWVLGNAQGIFAIGTGNWDDIDALIRTYDIEVCVIDALPEGTEARKIQTRYPGKVWLNYYKKEVRKADFVFWNYKDYIVSSDRSKIMGRVIDKMINRQIRFQMRIEELGEYIRHWQLVYKTTRKNALDIEEDVWDSTGDDHFVHATVYFELALERRGGTQEKGTGVLEYKPQEKINTGLAPDLHTWGQNKNII